MWGKLGVAVEGSAFDTDGFPIVIANERGPIDNNADGRLPELQRCKLDYQPDRSRQRVLPRRLLHEEDRVNGKVGEVNDTMWKSASGGVRVRLPDESDLQARVFVDVNTFHSTFLAVTAPSATVAPRSIVRLRDRSERADRRASARWCSGRKALGRSNFFSAGIDWRQVDGDSHEDVYIAAPGVPIVRRRSSADARCDATPAARSAAAALFVQDVFSRRQAWSLTLSARVDSWRNYDGHILETTVATGLPTAGNRRRCPTGTTRSSARAPAALYHVTDRVSVVGRLRLGLPRADAQRALSPVPRRR